MAITYVGKSASQAYGAADITVTVPSGYAQNDLLILLLDGRSATPATPSGWNSIATVSNTGAEPCYFRACYKVAGSSESSVTVTDSGYQTAGIMMAFRGVNTTSPINTYTTNTDTGTTFSATGVTTTVDGCMIVVATGFNDYGSAADTTNYSSWANSNLESITEAHDRWDMGAFPDYYGTGIAAAYGIKTSAGATGATTATTDDSTNCSAIITIALAPSGTVQTAAADITTTSTAEAVGIVTQPAVAAITTTSTAAASATLTQAASAAVTVTSTATSSGLVTKLATAAQTTTSTASSSGLAIRVSSAAVTTASTATAAGIAIKLASAAVNTTSTATASGAIATPWMSASVTTASTATAAGIVVKISAAAVTTTSTATAAGIAIKLAISAVTTTSTASAAGIVTKIAVAAVTTTSTAMAAALAVRIALSVQTTSTATASGIVIKLAASAVTTAGTIMASASVLIPLAAAAATTDIATATATLYTSPRLQDSAKLVVHLQAASLASHLASADLAASLPVCEIDIVLDNISLTAQQRGGITLGVTAMPIVSGTSISIYQGETLPIAVTVYDSTGSLAADLTVALFALKRSGSDTIIRDCVIDGSIVEVELSEADTLALLAGQYQYEFRVKSATGDVDSLVIGRLTVLTGLITAAVAPTGN